jgi:hypothetical protein
MRKRIWKDKDLWRTLAYSEYRDSREWRFLLALNPSYDIRYRPAAGVPIYTSGYIGANKKAPEKSGLSGLLKSPDMNLAKMMAGQDATTQDNPAFFPWSNVDSYADRMGEYTATALLSPDRTNGYTLDCPQSFSGSQRG